MALGDSKSRRAVSSCGTLLERVPDMLFGSNIHYGVDIPDLGSIPGTLEREEALPACA